MVPRSCQAVQRLTADQHPTRVWAPRFNIFIGGILAALLIVPTAWMTATQASPVDDRPPGAAGPALLIASLNTAMTADAEALQRELDAHPALREADVLFLQEVVRESGEPSTAEKLASRMGRFSGFVSPDGVETRGGLGIVSRVPLRDMRQYALKPQNLVFRSRKRIALGATVQTPLGDVRVINTHLDTRINPGERLNQLGPALADAESFKGPSVIGGDFNTNDMQWVSNVVPVPFPGWQASRVRVLMIERGFSTPFMDRRATFDHLGMQLDWLYTKGLRATGAGIQPMEISDHHAIWAQFAPN